MTWRWDEGVYTVTASIVELRQGRELLWDLTYDDAGRPGGFQTKQAIDNFVMVGPPKINWLTKPVPDDVLRTVAEATGRRWPTWLGSPPPGVKVAADLADLLIAVRDAPSDDAPRLAFARMVNAIDENRARLIELQCESAQSSEVSAEIAKLITKHSEAWAASLLAHNVRRLSYERGFITRVTMSLADVHMHGKAVLALAPIERLTIDAIGDASLENIPMLDRITGIEISAVRLDDLQLATLLRQEKSLAGISSWRLMDNRITARGVATLVRSPAFANASHVDFAGNPIGDAGVAALCETDLTTLRRLRLTDCVISADGVRALTKAPWFHRLEMLDLSSNPIGDAGAAAIAGAETATGLRQLALSATKLTNAAAVAIAGSAHLLKLEDLILSGNAIDAAGAKVLLSSESPGARRAVKS